MKVISQLLCFEIIIDEYHVEYLVTLGEKLVPDFRLKPTSSGTFEELISPPNTNPRLECCFRPQEIFISDTPATWSINLTLVERPTAELSAPKCWLPTQCRIST